SSDPAALVEWIGRHRKPEGEKAANPEVQISIGYDTGSLPWLEERARFLALYTYIVTTDLQRFQALVHRPSRDPNAAYGLVIRGDVLEARFPGQARGHRLDFVFPLPVRLSAANLTGLIRQLQVLNLGLLIACAEEAARVLLPEEPPAWLDDRCQAVA